MHTLLSHVVEALLRKRLYCWGVSGGSFFLCWPIMAYHFFTTCQKSGCFKLEHQVFYVTNKQKRALSKSLKNRAT